MLQQKRSDNNTHYNNKKRPHSNRNRPHMRYHPHRFVIILLDEDIIPKGYGYRLRVTRRLEEQVKVLLNNILGLLLNHLDHIILLVINLMWSLLPVAIGKDLLVGLLRGDFGGEDRLLHVTKIDLVEEG